MEIQQVIDYLKENLSHYSSQISIADNSVATEYYNGGLDATQEVLNFIQGVK